MNFRVAGQRRPLVRAVLRFALPFLLGLLVNSTLFRRHPIKTPSPRQLSQEIGGSLTVRFANNPHQSCPSGCERLRDKNDPGQYLSGFGESTSRVVLGANAEAEQPHGRDSLFLFVGVLSGRANAHRRAAAREAWVDAAQGPGVSVVRFILSEDERTPEVLLEAAEHDDIVFAPDKTDYNSLLYKTYYVMEHAVSAYDVRFVLKTDDDTFVNVPPLIRQLQLLCESPDCRSERLYMGRLAREAAVELDDKHKWSNVPFYNHTGLKQYPNYAMGGGYVLSADVAATLVKMHQMIRLKFTPIEDATLAVWLIALDLRHIDHPRFWTWGTPCCFRTRAWRQGKGVEFKLTLEEEIEKNICGADPWLVLHKIDMPFKMQHLAARVRQCQADDTASIPPSLAPFIAQRDVMPGVQVLPEAGSAEPVALGLGLS